MLSLGLRWRLKDPGEKIKCLEMLWIVHRGSLNPVQQPRVVWSDVFGVSRTSEASKSCSMDDNCGILWHNLSGIELEASSGCRLGCVKVRAGTKFAGEFIYANT
jgi:hypothetical protein